MGTILEASTARVSTLNIITSRYKSTLHYSTTHSQPISLYIYLPLSTPQPSAPLHFQKRRYIKQVSQSLVFRLQQPTHQPTHTPPESSIAPSTTPSSHQLPS